MSDSCLQEVGLYAATIGAFAFLVLAKRCKKEVTHRQDSNAGQANEGVDHGDHQSIMEPNGKPFTEGQP